MLEICSKCGNHEWDKEVDGNTIKCPKCGYKWKFEKLPIYFLTGCSGVGKTTTAIELQKLTDEYVILDVDWLRNVAWPQNDEEENNLIEQIFYLTKDISQSKKAVVWTMAGGLDRLSRAYGKRFFSEIKVLALTAEPETIRKRMTEGRGIDDAGWIQSSVDYNNYFRTHDILDDTKYDTLDCTNGTPAEIARKVLEWLRK
ncbi:MULTISPECIES: AAA family ATPase [Eubacterium]|jgi:chloramphenicol 3-O-phosphotransferase|uniref:AAA family ATPase n=1 Tax=Eubacterium TaxID=1730 RepID=UPI00265CA872|nr:AAA family ATPase [Eubacterium ventriosum]